MKKILLLAALVVASLQLTAANVDLATAKQSAQRFLMSQSTTFPDEPDRQRSPHGLAADHHVDP